MNYKISDDIFMESLEPEKAYKISEDIYEEAISLTHESVREMIADSYNISGRYWIWRMGNYAYSHDWERMFLKGEMQVEARGLKYLKSYPSIAAIENDYEMLHPDKVGITTLPPAYWAFCNYLRKGDVILACASATNLFAWGIVESSYNFKPTRTNGRHYRKVSWYKMEMPFIFTNKKPALFQIPREETNNLREALINKVDNTSTELPFGFADH